jgi:hypothetical protein
LDRSRLPGTGYSGSAFVREHIANEVRVFINGALELWDQVLERSIALEASIGFRSTPHLTLRGTEVSIFGILQAMETTPSPNPEIRSRDCQARRSYNTIASSLFPRQQLGPILMEISGGCGEN